MERTGQHLLETIEAFICKYVALPAAPAGQSLVLALWALHTWLYEHFPATPYLQITAPVKQAGKTLCMDVLAEISRNPIMLATLRPLAVLRYIEAHSGRCVLYFDEAEKLNQGAVGDLRSIFTTGYRTGGKHMITAPGGKDFLTFNTYAPKAFALIGEVMDVVRDRSITIHLQRLWPSVDYYANRTQAQTEGQLIVADVIKYFSTHPIPSMITPEFLYGREREIWTPLYSLAAALKINNDTQDRLIRATADLVGLKSAEAKKYTEAQAESEADTAKRVDGERAIRDLASVFRDGESRIPTATAIERMRALPAGPWRTYRGAGLTDILLAQLVGPFGVQSRPMRFGKGQTNNPTRRGYSRADVIASLPQRERE